MTDNNQRVNEQAELLPCPFCGGEAEMQTDGESGYWIECSNRLCASSTNIRISLMDDARPLVIEQWNRRAAIEQAAPEAPAAARDPLSGLQIYKFAKAYAGHPDHCIGEFVRLSEVRAALALAQRSTKENLHG